MNTWSSRVRAAIGDVARFLLPFLLILLAYKVHQLWPAEWRGRIRIEEPYRWEVSWFGIPQDDALVTPAQWWQTRTQTWLDAITGVAYLLFVPAFIASAAWWRFGPSEPNQRSERQRSAQLAMWALLALYSAGYVTYLIYPAAPPWYFEKYGAELVINAPPDAAGTLRFDKLVGAPLFANYYGKSLNIFGAIPSLHCGTSFLALLFALRLKSWRLFSAGQFIAVAFGSVYLNHHYIVDVLVGITYAIVAFVALARPGKKATSRG